MEVMMGKMKTFIVLVCGAFLVGTIIAPAAFAGGYHAKLHPKIKVMTYNLYVGADIFASVNPPPADFEDFVDRARQTIETVLASNFQERAQAIAKQIARKRPDLIGLQEVWSILGWMDDELLVLNYKEILLNALADLNLDYRVVATVQNTFIPYIPLSVINIQDFVMLADQDVILAREGVEILSSDSQNYMAKFILPLPPDMALFMPPIESLRGFVAVEALVRGRTYFFINTHLEVGGLPAIGLGGLPIGESAQSLQAQELVDYLSGAPLPIILVGDFNSSPEADADSPYAIIRKADYMDVWKRRLIWRRSPGYTCCQDEDLLNPTSLLSERIDLIWVRNDFKSRYFSTTGPVFAFTVGGRSYHKTPSGLWPSDHAGVSAFLRIPYRRWFR
jgi:endonuclease/exonuclease/phosphatase family metal-dependent hydrolase